MQTLHDLEAAQRIADRPLYGPLRDYRNDMPACSGDCAQGRHACSTPDACHLPEREGANPALGLLALAASAVLTIALLVHAAGWLGWLQ